MFGRTLRHQRQRWAKQALLEEQGGLCAYCRRPISVDAPDKTSLATWDEIVLRARGGLRSLSNRVVACLPCNSRKADQPVESFKPGWRGTGPSEAGSF